MDTNLPKKQTFIDSNYRAIPMFSQIEINVIGLCNRDCEFCPQVDEDRAFPVNLMEKVAGELGALDYNGLITFSGMGEPLLHEGLDELVAIVKKDCPNAITEVITNGDCLSSKWLNDLDKAGLDKLLVSLYDNPSRRFYFSGRTVWTKIEMVFRERWNSEHRQFNNRGGAINPLTKPLEYG